jgi:hypothetical protein
MMSYYREYAATSVGAAAYPTWTHAQSGTIVGVTSRGLFLRAASDRVLFLSYESYRGPLTINLPSSLSARFVSQPLVADCAMQFSADRLILPTIGIAISISGDVIWHAPLTDAPLRSPAAIRRALRSIVNALPAQRLEGLGELLVPLLDRTVPTPEDQTALFATLAPLPALLTQHFPLAAENAIELLGRGRGLTPSGDDCVLGLLLTLHRWARLKARFEDGNMLKHLEMWSEFNQRVIDVAYQRTTTLSANLIECAAQGEADERLISVVDGIMTGEPSVADCAKYILDWGSSSGIDALVGMAIVLTAF